MPERGGGGRCIISAYSIHLANCAAGCDTIIRLLSKFSHAGIILLEAASMTVATRGPARPMQECTFNMGYLYNI